MLCQLVIVNKLQFLEVSYSLNVIVNLESMSIESHQRHRKVTVVCDFTQLINQVKVCADIRKSRILEFSALKELCAFLELLLNKLKLLNLPI